MRVKPIRDPEYIAYIETRPCAICGHIPMGTRKLYNEYTDTFKEYPCKNTAHHVDNMMTRTKNDHRVVPLCSHYTVSGKDTRDCHMKVHGYPEYKTKESREVFIKSADEYYKLFSDTTIGDTYEAKKITNESQ